MASPRELPRVPPGLPSWFHENDPWLAARMRRVNQIRRAEADVGAAVLKAMAAYLAQARRDVLGDAVTAAASDESIKMDNWPGRPLWMRLVAEFVMPIVRAVFLLAFDDTTPPGRDRRHDIEDVAPEDPEGEPADGKIIVDSRHYQRAYLDKVNDRLRQWPDDAFDKIRAELQAGLAMAEDQRALRDRVGRALDIDARSRALARQIDQLTRTIDNPDTPPQIIREARARRSALYRNKDRADSLWWPSAARIARTEANTALNGGSYAGAAANTDADGQERWVQWWSTTDERVRPSHWAAHMQVRKLGEKFDVGGHKLDHPGDPTAPADEVINCRCSTLVLHSQDAADEQTRIHDRMLPGRTDNRGRPIDRDGQVLAADAQGERVKPVPGYEGSVGPFPGEYAEPHVYARDVHSGAGNCVCGTDPGDDLHVQIAPGVPVPEHRRAGRKFAEDVMAQLTTQQNDSAEDTAPADTSGDLPKREVRTARWRSPLNRMGGSGRALPVPPDGVLRTRQLPMSLLWKKTASHGNVDTEGAVDVGVVTDARIEVLDGQVWVTGTAEIDMGNPDGVELARRIGQGWLRWISLMADTDPDSVEPFEVEPAIVDSLAEEDDVADPVEGAAPWQWRMGNVTVLAQPELDEAVIELDDADAPEGERPEDLDPEDVRAVKSKNTSGWTSGMVALIPADPAALAVEGGDPVEQLHMTLAYLGEVTEWPEKYVQAVHRVAQSFAGLAAEDTGDDDLAAPYGNPKPLTANVFSHAVFNPNGAKHDPATVYLFDGDGDRGEIEMLAHGVQSQLRTALGDIDFPEQHSPWVPHVTAGYGLPVSALSFTGPVVFDRLRVALADDTVDYPLGAGDALVAAVTGNTGLPLADRTRAWDGPAARRRVASWARDDAGEISPERMAQAFLWRDNDADKATAGAYRFGIADIIGGRLMIVPRAVFAAAASLQGARGGTTVPEADQARMRSKINTLYRQMRQAWDDPALVPPWEHSTTAGLARRRRGEHRTGDVMTHSLMPSLTASSAVLEEKRQSWAHRLADVAAELFEPPSDWFEDPKLDKPTPLTITRDGRVYGHAHDWTTKHVSYADRDVHALKDRENYRAFNLRPVRCADGRVVAAGALVKGGHASTIPGTPSYTAQAHYDDPSKRVARVRAGRDEHGTWVAGALVPGITPREVLDLAELSLSADWREVDFGAGTGKFIGVSVVNNPGLPIIVPSEEDMGGYDDATALVAAGAIVRERPAWAEEVGTPSLEELADQFGVIAAEAHHRRLRELEQAVVASGTDPAAEPSTVDAAVETVAPPVENPGLDVLAALDALVNGTAPADVVAADSGMRERTERHNGEVRLGLLGDLVNGRARAEARLAASAALVHGGIHSQLDRLAELVNAG